MPGVCSIGRAVDAGDGWLIFALPPAELAVHPTDDRGHQELYLMCDDIEETIRDLEARGVHRSPVKDEGWRLSTSLQLPGGEELGLNEPRHETALALRRSDNPFPRRDRFFCFWEYVCEGTSPAALGHPGVDTPRA
jgi:hypothetical protein